MPEPIAAEIAHRVLARYQTCDTYADHGRYEGILGPDRSPHERRYDVIVFETRLRRPGSFYFEYRRESSGPRESWRGHVLWQHDGVCRLWPGLNAPVDETSLDLALAAVTGVSRGTAAHISRLLLPETKGVHTLLMPDHCERLPDVEIDDRPYWRVRLPPDLVKGPPSYIIDRQTLLIRRIERTAVMNADSVRRVLDSATSFFTPAQRAALERRLGEEDGRRQSVEVIDYSARFDVDLDDSAFRFEPPD